MESGMTSSNTANAHIRLGVFLGTCVAILVTGCGIPGNRAGESGADLPTSFNGVVTSENSSQLPVDEFFSDPILVNLICEALAGNQELKILGEEIQIANNEVLKRSGSYLPFFRIGAGAGLDKPSLFTRAGAVDSQVQFRPGQSLPSPLPDFLGAANVTWQVDIWRQLRNAQDAASLRYLGTTEGRNYIVTRLVAEIAENYYRLISLDKQLENLDRTIALQEQSLKVTKALKEQARGTELPVQRFQAEVRKNQSEKLIIRQQIIEVENRINFLCGRYPQPVERMSVDFLELNLHSLQLGVPSDLLQNRPDIRQAEQQLEAAGLDIQVARANFYPQLIIRAGAGFEGFNPRYVFNSPDSLIYNVAGDLVAPLINKRAIQADYMTANAMQLQAVYNYQRVVLNAFTEVVNRISKVDNYRKSIEIKKQQLAALEASVETATRLWRNVQLAYIDVLLAQRDMMDARRVLIDTKREELSAIVSTYQALGGGLFELEFGEMTASMSGVSVPAVPDAADLIQSLEETQGLDEGQAVEASSEQGGTVESNKKGELPDATETTSESGTDVPPPIPENPDAPENPDPAE